MKIISVISLLILFTSVFVICLCAIIDFTAEKEIVKIECYDNNNNKITWLTCDKTQFVDNQLENSVNTIFIFVVVTFFISSVTYVNTLRVVI